MKNWNRKNWYAVLGGGCISAVSILLTADLITALIVAVLIVGSIDFLIRYHK